MKQAILALLVLVAAIAVICLLWDMETRVYCILVGAVAMIIFSGIVGRLIIKGH